MTTSAGPEQGAEDLYENAPCGYVTTLPDGQIVRVNSTLLTWLGYPRDEMIGRPFTDLLSVGGRIYHETHFAPLLQMQGEVGGIAFDMLTSEGEKLPVLVSSSVKKGEDQQPLLVRTTVFDARDRRAYERELLRVNRAIDRERARLHRLVSTLQRTLLPPALPDVPGIEVAAHYHIASPDEVGGDFYDIFPLTSGGWGFFLGDVCGKGADAAVMTSLIRYSLRAAAIYDPDPATVLAYVNTAMLAEPEQDTRFCSVIFGRLFLDRENASIVLASGGHPPALLLRGDGSVEFLPTPGGQLLGVLPVPRIADVHVELHQGDTLMLYTDGLTEAMTGGGAERLGEAGLQSFAGRIAPVRAAALVEKAADLLLSLGAGLSDDTAVLAMGIAPAAARVP